MNVSAVIPVYNGAEFVREAVESVLCQTKPPLECIVVDDGSTDATPSILAEFGESVRYEHLDRRGVSAARNHGTSLARGELIAFLDHDDAWMPEKLERQLACRATQRADIVLASMNLTDRHGAYLETIRFRPRHDLVTGMLLFDGTELVGSSSVGLFPRSLLEELGGYDTALSTSADFDLLIRAALAGAVFATVDEPLARYRRHGANMSDSVSRLERDMLRAYANTFANPALPAAVRAKRRLAYSRLRWMLAGSYLRAGGRRDFVRNAIRGLAGHPDFGVRALKKVFGRSRAAA